MSEDAIRQWKSHFLCVENVTNYLMDQFNDKENPTKVVEERANVAALARLMMDLAQQNTSGYGIVYRWLHQTYHSLPSSMYTQKLAKSLHEPDPDIEWIRGCFLQLKFEDDWDSWVYIASSKIKKGEKGLYSACFFNVFVCGL